MKRWQVSNGSDGAARYAGPQGSRDEQFEIHACGRAERSVRLVQRRAFESGQPPHATRDFALLVT